MEAALICLEFLLFFVRLLLQIFMIIFRIALRIFMLFMRFFLMRIDVVNSWFFGVASGLLLYLNNRNFVSFFPHNIHPAICVAVGIALLVAVLFLQRTKVGFWIFAIPMSILWAFPVAAIAFRITENWIVFYVVAGLALIINILLHINTHRLDLPISEVLGLSQQGTNE